MVVEREGGGGGRGGDVANARSGEAGAGQRQCAPGCRGFGTSRSRQGDERRAAPRRGGGGAGHCQRSVERDVEEGGGRESEGVSRCRRRSAMTARPEGQDTRQGTRGRRRSRGAPGDAGGICWTGLPSFAPAQLDRVVTIHSTCQPSDLQRVAWRRRHLSVPDRLVSARPPPADRPSVAKLPAPSKVSGPVRTRCAGRCGRRSRRDSLRDDEAIERQRALDADDAGGARHRCPRSAPRP